MRTHFKFALLAILTSASVMASTCSEEFASNKDAVLAGTCLSSGDVCFGIGKGFPRGNSVLQQEAARNKAELAAKVNLICRKSASGIVWPKNIAPEHQAILAALTARKLTLSACVKGVEVVYRAMDANRVQTAVVAVKSDALNAVPLATFADAKRILLEPHWLKRNFRKYSDVLYAFYLSQKQLPESLRGTSYREWTDAQLNEFCGIPNVIKPSQAHNPPSPVLEEVKESEDVEFLPQFILPPYATANENETIGF